MDLTHEIGKRLRAVRLSRGLTLKMAAAASRGRFRPSSIAGYERGERAISVQRFCDLADLYDADPARLLDGVIREARREPSIRVDLVALEEANEPAASSVRSLAHRVLELRDEPAADVVVSLRRADIETLAVASGLPPIELLAMLATTSDYHFQKGDETPGRRRPHPWPLPRQLSGIDDQRATQTSRR